MAKRARISDQVVTGVPAPARGGPSPIPERIVRVEADPLHEYVAGGQYSWVANYIRALPFYVDDLARDFGDDIYDRMLNDAQVRSCVDILKLGVLSQGMRLVPPVTDEKSPERALAEEIAQFCQANLDRLPAPFLASTCWELLDALAYGSRVAEQTYEVVSEGPLAGRLCLRQLKVKPRRTYSFVVDSYLNTLGLLALIPGQAFPVLVNSILGDPAQIPNLLPRSKFAVLTYRPRNGDPRGTSLLRAAYDPWWCKQQVKAEYLQYQAQFAGPSLVGETAEGAQALAQVDEAGNPVLDAAGNPVIVNPEDVMLQRLLAFRNGTAMAVPHGSSVKPIQVQGEGAPFLSALDWYDNQISKAILCQTLATQEAQHQARASSEVHQDTLGLVRSHGREALEAMIAQDILRPLVRYNYGPQALHLVPRVSLAETEEQDFAADAAAMASLGYSLHPSQYPGVDARLNLPERSPEAVQEAIAQKQAPPAGPEEKPGEEAGSKKEKADA